MQGITTVDGVDQFCSQLYAGDKAVTNAFTATGWPGCVRELGLPLLMRVIAESQSAQSVVFACRALDECIDDIFKHDGAAALTEMGRAVFDRLRGAQGSPPARAAQGAMERLIGVVVRCGYRHAPDVAHMVSHFLAAGQGLIRSEPAQSVAGSALVQLCAVCGILGSIVDAVSEEEPFVMTAKATGAVSTASRFRDDYLLELYAFASTVIKRVGRSTALEAALRLQLSLMNYIITCSRRADDGDVDSWVCTAVPTQWRATVIDLSLVRRLWTLFQTSGATESVLKTILEILTRYVGVKADQFPGATQREQWLEVTLLQTHVVMEQSQHLEADDVRALFAILLNRIKPASSLDHMAASPSFVLWLQSCVRFTQTCLSQCALSDPCVLSLLSMWSALSGARSYAAAPVDGLTGAIATVVTSYFAAVAQAVAACVVEIGQGEGGSLDAAADYILADDPEGAHLQMRFVVGMAASGDKNGTGVLQRFAQTAFEHGRATVFQEGESATAPILVTAVEEVSWLLRLAAVSLSELALGSNPDATESVVFFALLFMFLWSRNGNALCRLPTVTRGHLEEAATALCEAVGRVLLIPSSAVSRKVGKGLASRLVAAQVLASDADFTTWWLDIVLERCWYTLWATNTSVRVQVAGLQYLCQLAGGPSALRAMRGSKALHRFVNLEAGHVPPPRQEGQWHRIRFLYARCVAQLRLADTVLLIRDEAAVSQGAAPTTLRHLAQPILSVWNSIPEAAADGAAPTTAQHDERVLLASLCDARGLLFASTRRHFVGLVELFLPYIPRLVRCILTSSPTPKPIAVQLVKLTGEMSLNRSQRAFFGNHSVLGIQLEQHAQRVVVAASTALACVAQHNATNSATASEASSVWMWKMLRGALDIGRNVLRGGYCNWAELTFFHDDGLPSLLNTLWPLVCNVGLLDGVQHPKVLLSLLHFVNELFVPFFASFWESRSGTEAQYVLGFVEAIAFPSVAVQESAKTYAMGVLQRLVELCSAHRVDTCVTEEEASQCARVRRLFHSLDPERLHRIITCCIESVLSTNESLSTSLGNLLRASLLAEGTHLSVVADYFSARCPTPQSANAFMAVCQEAAECAVAGDAEGIKISAEQIVSHLRACL